jgi:hypothetical protein
MTGLIRSYLEALAIIKTATLKNANDNPLKLELI